MMNDSVDFVSVVRPTVWTTKKVEPIHLTLSSLVGLGLPLGVTTDKVLDYSTFVHRAFMLCTQ